MAKEAGKWLITQHMNCNTKDGAEEIKHSFLFGPVFCILVRQNL